MGIVVNIHKVLLFDTVVKATPHTGKTLKTTAQLVLVYTTAQSYSRSCYGILHIKQRCAVKLQVIHHTFRCTHVKEYVTIISTHIYRIVVGINTVRGIGCIWPFYEGKALMGMLVMFFMLVVVMMVPKQFTIGCSKNTLLKEQLTISIGLIGKLGVCLKHCLMCAIYIQMIRVCGCYYGIMRMQLQERTVVLISLDNDILALFIHMEIAVEVLADAAKESTTTDVCMAQQMRNKRTRGCFAMTASNSYTFLTSRQFTKNMRTFLHLHTTLFQHNKLIQILRHSRCIYHQVNVLGDEVGVVTIVYTYTLFLQFRSKR